MLAQCQDGKASAMTVLKLLFFIVFRYTNIKWFRYLGILFLVDGKMEWDQGLIFGNEDVVPVCHGENGLIKRQSSQFTGHFMFQPSPVVLRFRSGPKEPDPGSK